MHSGATCTTLSAVIILQRQVSVRGKLSAHAGARKLLYKLVRPQVPLFDGYVLFELAGLRVLDVAGWCIYLTPRAASSGGSSAAKLALIKLHIHRNLTSYCMLLYAEVGYVLPGKEMTEVNAVCPSS